jgi:hypothetical protein
MAYMVLFTAVFFLVAVINLYQVARAKLQVQNIADEVALAVAALQAKSINVVMDRDEWLNHMYPEDQKDPKKKAQFPGISDAAKHPFDSTATGSHDAYQYAQLVNTINMAQMMFQQAYNRFLGASDGTTGQSYGAGGLSAILHEIAALNDSNVRVIVFNNNSGEDNAKQHAQDVMKNGKSNFPVTTDNIEPQAMASVPFITEEVHLEKNDHKTLTEVLYGSKDKIPPHTTPVGWMRPDWDNSQNSLKVKTGSGQESGQIGAGAIVIKHIQLQNPFFRDVYVKAESKAYVVKGSGLSVKPGTLRAGAGGMTSAGQPATTTGDPPPTFHPTYYVKLGAPS